MNKIYTTILVLVLSGCGGDSKKSQSPEVPDPTQPNPGEVLSNQLKLQAIPDSSGVSSSDLGGITSLNKIQRLANNRFLILGEASDQAKNGLLEGLSTITNDQGETASFLKNTKGYADACVHPSGEYSMAAFLPAKDKFSQIEIQRYSKTHQLLYSAPMTATTLESKYNINFDRDEWLTSPFEIIDNPLKNIDNKYRQHSISWGRFGLITFNCDQEELLIAFNNSGQKLAKYSAELTFQWEKVTSIYYWANNERKSISNKIVHKDNGDIYVIDTLTSNAIPAYNHRFESNLSLANNTRASTSHILFKHLNAQGDTVYETIFPSTQSHYLKDIALYQDTLYVGSISALEKSDAINNTLELDISLTAINTKNNTHSQNFYDINNEDWLNGLTLHNDSLYLFGHTGGSQVDSNSWVVDGNAFYARFNLTSKTLEAANVIKHKRSSEIKDLVISDDKVIAVGVTNAPLTHSTDISQQGLFITQYLSRK